MVIVQILCAAAFAALGRWMLLHPESVFPKGSFVAVSSPGAKLSRLQVLIIGSLAVFAGTTLTLTGLFSLIPIHFKVLAAIESVIALAAGVYALLHVRREVAARPAPQTGDPNGWWPS
jgi:hypothetical protein